MVFWFQKGITTTRKGAKAEQKYPHNRIANFKECYLYSTQWYSSYVLRFISLFTPRNSLDYTIFILKSGLLTDEIAYRRKNDGRNGNVFFRGKVQSWNGGRGKGMEWRAVPMTAKLHLFRGHAPSNASMHVMGMAEVGGGKGKGHYRLARYRCYVHTGWSR